MLLDAGSGPRLPDGLREVGASLAAAKSSSNLSLRKRPPRLRFSLGEGYTVGANGADEYLGEVLHACVD